LAGYGPIPAPVAAALAFDPTGTWHRLLTDHTGTVTHVSRGYRPAGSLAEFVTARDRTCRFPGCPRPAARCQLDHVVPYRDGGATSAENLQALCARHHHLKHEAGWSVRRRDDGITEWTDPTGRTYQKPPDEIPRDTTLDPPPEPPPEPPGEPGRNCDPPPV
jgi:HNH endonuclease